MEERLGARRGEEEEAAARVRKEDDTGLDETLNIFERTADDSICARIACGV